eukprot:10133992-Lingulodinium_polyedra.AAC.1
MQRLALRNGVGASRCVASTRGVSHGSSLLAVGSQSNVLGPSGTTDRCCPLGHSHTPGSDDPAQG